MRAEAVCNGVGLDRSEAVDLTPLGATLWERAGDMDMDVRNRLVGRDAVVLPHRHTLWVEGPDDGLRRPDDIGHDSRLFRRREFQNRLPMAGGDHQNVTATPRLVGDKHRRDVVSVEDRVWAVARGVLAERAWGGWREDERHQDHAARTVSAAGWNVNLVAPRLPPRSSRATGEVRRQYGGVTTSIEVREADVVGTFIAPEGQGPYAGVVALSGSGGGVPSWWGDLLAPHGVAVLAAAYFGVEPLPSALCEIPVETVAAAGEWLRRQPQVRSGHVGLVGGSKGAELALLAATAYPDLLGPVAAIAPSCVAWFGVDLTGGVADASARSSWTLGGRPVPFVPPVPGIGFEWTERGLRSVGIYAAALAQADAAAAAAIPVERVTGPLLLLPAETTRRAPRA